MKNCVLARILVVAVVMAASFHAYANIPGGGTGTGPNVTLVDNGSVTIGNGIVSIVCAKSGATINQINYTYNNGGGPQTINLLSGGNNGGRLYWELGGFTTGDSFKLFGAGSYAGTFNGYVLPAITGNPMSNTNTLNVSGTLSLAPVRVVPRETGVLLLPALDATADAAHMLAPRQLVIRHREEYEFITRQFKMLGETMAAGAAKTAPNIDLGNLSARSAGNLDVLAQRTGATWVVSIVVEKAELEPVADGDRVRTRVRLEIWDARRHGWLARTPYTGEAYGGGSPVFMFKNSLDEAVKGALATLLHSYPPVVTVLQENSLNDYLADQTTPFVGDPKTPFSGLAAKP
jgi:hypothetical protein